MPARKLPVSLTPPARSLAAAHQAHAYQLARAAFGRDGRVPLEELEGEALLALTLAAQGYRAGPSGDSPMSEPHAPDENRRIRLRALGWKESGDTLFGLGMWESPEGAVMTEQDAFCWLAAQDGRKEGG